MEPKTGKRMVSRGAYAALMGQKATLSALGSLLVATAWVVGCINFSVILFILVMWVVQWAKDPGTEICLIPVVLSVCLILVVPLRFLLRLGYQMMYKANTMEQVVPLTRHNTADLPVSESLVRASSEPMQAHEAVLLRAAKEGQEAPPEEMLRASTGLE